MPFLRIMFIIGVLMVGRLDGEEPWPLQVFDLDTLILTNGDPRLGTIEAVRPDGSILFTEAGSSGAIGYLPKQFQGYRYRRSASQVIDQRMGIFLDPDREEAQPFEIIATLRWAVEMDDEALVPVIKNWAQQAALAIPEHLPLLEYSLRILQAGEDDHAIEAIARAGVAANPNWETGYNQLLALLVRQERFEDLREAISLTLTHRLNNHLANRLFADQALRDGDIAEAREAYRKASATNDAQALEGYAITSLMLREWNTAERSAQQLITVGEHLPSAMAILGTVRLHQGEEQEASSLLDNAWQSGSLQGPLAVITAHNLGIVRQRLGDSSAALAVLADNDHPASRLATAIFSGQANIPSALMRHPQLGPMAIEYQAISALSAGRYEEAIAEGLDADTRPRHRFLEQVRAMMAERGAATRVRTLALTPGVESLRWQLYGHLLAERWQDAWTVASSLDDNDGYAAVAKAYIRASSGEPEGAALIYRQQVQPMAEEGRGNPPPPAAYVAVLAAEFDTAQGEYRRYDFNWPNGERLGPGWDQELTPGSGIRLSVNDQALSFASDANVNRPGLARAWCRVREQIMERVILEATYPQDEQVLSGLEILDGDRQQGVAVAVAANRTLRWRQMRNGQWQAWRDFPSSITLAADQHLTLYYRSPGRVQIRDADNQAQSVGESFSPSGYLSVSIFAEARGGGDWELRAQRLDIGQRQP